ncbi:MAG: Hpt domain-containing protein [Nitrosomonadales bacterium]|nr:Hpt domain-containing protein [Nitrosomonadales bacterium]
MDKQACLERDVLDGVLPGLVSELARLRMHLERYFAAANADELKQAQDTLQKLLGALGDAGLQGLAAFCAELDAGLKEMRDNAQPLAELHVEVFRRALDGLSSYLGALAGGADDAALRLFPQYQELQHLRGLEMSFELDLFYPALEVALPESVSGAHGQTCDQAHLKALRSHYQVGLMNWLRQHEVPSALQTMRQALRDIMGCVPDSGRAFWWVAGGVVECLAGNAVPAELNVRRLLGRIDQHIRAVIEEERAEARSVINEMLYLIGSSTCGSESLDAIRRTYGLDYYLRFPSPLVAAEHSQLLEAMRAQLGALQECWAPYVQGDKAAGERCRELASRLAAQAEKLDRNILQHLARHILAAVQQAETPEQARTIALDMAKALLLYGHGIEHYEVVGSRFQRQAQLLCERIQAVLHQQHPGAAQPELAELYCRMARDEVNQILASEILANVQRARQSLHAFLRDPLQRNELAVVVRQLNQAHGAISFAGLDTAQHLLGLVKQHVSGYAQRGDTPDGAQGSALSAAVAALESFLEQQARRQGGDMATLLAALSGLEQALPPAPSQPAESRLEKTTSRADAGDAAELLEVFLEEAHEVLDTMRANMALFDVHPASREPLTVIRRGFHTLKGSSRMVGLGELGEVAWCVERALNRWLKDNKPPTPGLLRFIDSAARDFAAWVEALDQQGAADIEADELIAAAQRIENGEDSDISAVSTPAETVVTIGEHTLSAALFDIASVEAEQNVELLRQHLQELRGAPGAQVKYDFMRAAHTLASVARSIGVAPLAELAHALEDGLQAYSEHAGLPGAAQMELLQQVIDALVLMVQRVRAKQMPHPRADLAEQLLARPALTTRVEAAAQAVAPPPAGTSAASIAPAAAVTEIAARQHVRDAIDEQLLPVFIEEADELCPRIGAVLRAWRGQPEDPAHPASLKRLLHTLKGSARMAGAMRIGEISHEIEARVLSAAQRQGESGYWDGLENDFDHIVSLLEELRKTRVAAEVRDDSAGQARQGLRVERRSPELVEGVLRVRADVVDRLVNQAGELSVARSRMESEMRAIKEGLLELTSSVVRLRKQLREVEIQAESQMQARVMRAKESVEQFDPLEFDRFTRLQELTRFMNESVHDVQTVQQSLLKNFEVTGAALQAQARLNRELQKSLMGVRMVPFSSISERLYHIVRQTGKELNKRANLELFGTNVELDRSVLEKMTAPFEHLLRNAMVHGLETAEQRVQQGKNPIGEIQLRLRQESNEVVFEFNDDGAGLNFAALREKAIAKGLLQADAAVSEQQLAEMIFTSGISTATEVTEVAGRGIGMDVVRSEIVGLGGRIDISSTPGQGTRFVIHLPLTLAIAHALIVRAGEHRYAIPTTMVEQVRQVRAPELALLYRDHQVSWQGNAYPLYYLAHLLGEAEHAPENLPRNSLVLLRSGEQRIALHLDEIFGNQDVVVKNIGPQLARLPGIAGATVGGDGAVVLILNPVQLAQRIAAEVTGAKTAPPLRSEPLVMVVDDSLTVRKVTTRLLNRAGYQVVTAKDGVDALEQLAEVHPSVMLLDIEMPRMDGFELAKQLRREARTERLPIIMITSRTADKHRDYAMQLGVNAYFGKPYPEQALLEKIAELVGEPEME